LPNAEVWQPEPEKTHQGYWNRFQEI